MNEVVEGIVKTIDNMEDLVQAVYMLTGFKLAQVAGFNPEVVAALNRLIERMDFPAPLSEKL